MARLRVREWGGDKTAVYSDEQQVRSAVQAQSRSIPRRCSVTPSAGIPEADGLRAPFSNAGECYVRTVESCAKAISTRWVKWCEFHLETMKFSVNLG